MKFFACLSLLVLFLITLAGCEIPTASSDHANGRIVVGRVMSVTKLNRDAARKQDINTGDAVALTNMPDNFLAYSIKTDHGALIVMQNEELGTLTPTEFISKIQLGLRYAFRVKSFVMPSGTPVNQDLVVPFSEQEAVMLWPQQ